MRRTRDELIRLLNQHRTTLTARFAAGRILPGLPWRGHPARVAQVGNLLCRRLAVGRPRTSLCGCGLAIRDTADSQSALRWFHQDAPQAKRDTALALGLSAARARQQQRGWARRPHRKPKRRRRCALPAHSTNPALWTGAATTPLWQREAGNARGTATPGTAHEPEINAKPPRHEANSKAGNTEIQNGFTTGH